MIRQNVNIWINYAKQLPKPSVSFGKSRSSRKCIAQQFRAIFCQCDCCVWQRICFCLYARNPFTSNPFLKKRKKKEEELSQHFYMLIDKLNQTQCTALTSRKSTFGKSPAFRRVINFKNASLSPAYSWLRWRKTTIKPLSLWCSKRKNDSRHSYLFENKAITEMCSARCRIFQESLEINSVHDLKKNRCLSVSGQYVICQWGHSLTSNFFLSFFSIYPFYFYSQGNIWVNNQSWVYLAKHTFVAEKA